MIRAETKAKYFSGSFGYYIQAFDFANKEIPIYQEIIIPARVGITPATELQLTIDY
jgi:hypothetical protein